MTPVEVKNQVNTPFNYLEMDSIGWEKTFQGDNHGKSF